MTQSVTEKTAMKRICAWCNKVMQDGVEPATHGICQPCGKKVMENYERRRGESSSVCGGPIDPHRVPLMI